jgi:glycosyltransferase involved in cell wall biosynthesis
MGSRDVVEVVGSLAVGGAERVAIEVAAGLAERGWRADLLCAGPEARGADFDRSVEGEAKARGVPVHHLDFRSITSGDTRRRLAAFLRERKPAVVHVHNRPHDWQVVAACTALGIPVVYTVHLTYQYPRLRQRALYAACGLLVPTVICVSRAVAENVVREERVHRGKVKVVYNGIRMELFRPASPEDRAAKRQALGWAPETFVWICAARLNAQKGHRWLLEGFARLPATSRARLVLAGDGPLQAELEAQAARLGIADRVQFLGARRDVPALLAAADGFATATLQEGHPLALLEAMASGLPVVAPRLPTVLEVAPPSGGTVLFGPDRLEQCDAHDPAHIADVLAAVEADAARHRQAAATARAHVASRFSREAMIDGHAAIYEDVAALATRPLWTRLARRLVP